MVVDIRRPMQPARLKVVSDQSGVENLYKLKADCMLAGGIGWFVNRLGITAAGLESIEIMLSDSKLVTASETENSDLFWALKGGGSNFGIVCRLVVGKYRCRDPLTLLAGDISYISHSTSRQNLV